MGDDTRSTGEELQRAGIYFIGQQPAFFREGVAAANRQIEREACLRRSLMDLTITSPEEARKLRASCPLALDALVRQLKMGDRVWWGWVEKTLEDIRA